MTGERYKTKSLLLGPSFWESGRRAVFVLLPLIPSQKVSAPLLVWRQLLPLIIFHFHSVLSLPISQQGHIPPSFSPLTVKPYHQAEYFKVSGNSIQGGSVNSWDTLSLKIKLVNVQHKSLFVKQHKMVYFENGSLSQKVTGHTLVQSAKRNFFKGWSDRFANIFLLHLLKHTRGFSVKTRIFTRSKDQSRLMFIQWTQGSKRI